MKHEDTDHSNQDHKHCPYCGFEISPTSDACGECLCEDDCETY